MSSLKLRSGRTIAIACGIAALALAGWIALHLDEALFLWHGYRLTWLPRDVLPTIEAGHLLNDSGQVGVFDAAEGAERAGRWSFATEEVVWMGGLTDAECRPTVQAVSPSGSMIGTVCANLDAEPSRAFLWTEKDGMIEIPALGDRKVRPLAVNGKDQVVGWMGNRERRSPFLWSPGSPVLDLSAGTGEGLALAIDENGWVAGQCSDRPFLWKPETGMRDIALPPGVSDGSAYDFDERGELLIAGWSFSSALVAFRWTEEKGFVPIVPNPFLAPVEMNRRGDVLFNLHGLGLDESAAFLASGGAVKRLPVPFGYSRAEYSSINDRGWILGTAIREEKSGEWTRRGFIARPLR